jgi:DNA-binding response OmpR family regulator
MQASGNNLDVAFKSARILLVGADFGTRKSIRTLLLSAGVTDVHDAPEGEAGLAIVADLDPDVVILDWQAPGMHGAEFVRRLRADDRLSSASVPIIMLTDHRASVPVAEAMRLGVRDFLVKPVSAPALRERLGLALMTPRLRRAPAPSLQPQDAPQWIDHPSADAIVAE